MTCPYHDPEPPWLRAFDGSLPWIIVAAIAAALLETALDLPKGWTVALVLGGSTLAWIVRWRLERRKDGR